ncbi:MAG: hypothetical protein GY798_31615 [Hyphomicrobiales bacterium]|nr:hypothetical protein [Hyphomicrobiales bacterium]
MSQAIQSVKIALPLLLLLLAAGFAHAVELRATEVRRGTNGLDGVTLTIENRADAPIACLAELAHWYSTELAVADAGATARVDLWFDPETGTYSVLNDKAENMPVEALWSGLAGRTYETRATVALTRKVGERPPAIDLTCIAAADRLRCR